MLAQPRSNPVGGYGTNPANSTAATSAGKPRGCAHRALRRTIHRLDAARREATGEVVVRRSDGLPYDYINEVRDAQVGLLNRIERIKQRLGYPKLSPTDRAELRSALGEASRLLDYSERYVSRRR